MNWIYLYFVNKHRSNCPLLGGMHLGKKKRDNARKWHFRLFPSVCRRLFHVAVITPISMFEGCIGVGLSVRQSVGFFLSAPDLSNDWTNFIPTLQVDSIYGDVRFNIWSRFIDFLPSYCPLIKFVQVTSCLYSVPRSNFSARSSIPFVIAQDRLLFGNGSNIS